MRKLIAVFLFVVFTAFLALAANPADDVKKRTRIGQKQRPLKTLTSS